jgi:hypothetical protein
MSFERAGSVVNVKGVDIEVDIRGSGAPVFVLPSEEAWEADLPLIDELAKSRKVIIAYPPGFGRSARPDFVTHPDDHAYIMLDLIEQMDLKGAALVGFSLGGWIAAEMATKDDSRFSRLVLVDALGVKVGGPTDVDIQDIWVQHPATVAALKWADPEKGKRDFSSWPDAALTIVARNMESFARFCWEPYMHNPKLRHRLHRIGVPTHLIWGEKDGVVTPAYGKAYAGLIPGATFETIAGAGHFPQVEQPAAFAKALTAALA